MSIAAVKWAIEQNIKHPSTKLVLMTLAHYANREDWTSFREKSALAKDTGLSLKTVKTALKVLRDDGYLEETDKRRGVTNQIIVFRLCSERGEGTTPLCADERGEDITPLTEIKGGKSGHERGVNKGRKGGKFRAPSIEEPEEPDESTTLLWAREVTEKVSEIVGANPVKSPAWMAAQPVVTVWLQRGADPEQDIYPTVRRLMARFSNGHDPPSPNYFTKAIDEARANRVRMLNAPEPENYRTSGQNRTQGASGDMPAFLAAVGRNAGRGR